MDATDEDQDGHSDASRSAPGPEREAARVTEADIVGLKYFDRLLPLLKRLEDDGCARDKAGNRELHYDQYCLLVLLYLFNPICSSLRAVQQASELKNVQRRLGCGRASLGSLSEASTVFDPQRLIEIIQELGSQVQPLTKDPRLQGIQQTLTLVDATLIAAMPRIMAASVMKQQSGSGMVKWRLHTHFEVDRHVPVRIDVTRDGGGDQDERAVLERTIDADRCYVMDRGYAKFKLFNAIVAKGSSYVCRVRDNSVYEVLTEQPLTAADRAARVLSDQVVLLGQNSKKNDRPNHPIRLVVVKIKPHVSKGKYKGGSSGVDSDGFLRIATNLLDVPAEIIALLYAYRWTIEIFFRQFKHLLGCRHLLSHNQNGIEIQTYCAIIACLLIALWTGRQPTKRTQEMLCYFLTGWASAEEVAAHIAKLKASDEQAAKTN
ncbi:MAG: transposase [Planctomycetaceae bacterium]|nr:transposase [Planctomycetaceae bacterium]